MKFNIDLENMLYLPFNVYWKNTTGYYIGCNDKSAELINLNSRKDIVGMRLHDFCNDKTASVIEKIDKKIIEEKKSHCVIEHAILKDNQKSSYLSMKFPLFTNTNIITGLFGISLNLKLFNSSVIFPLLSQMGLKISLQQSQKIIKNALISFHYQEIDGVKLSKRESECLYYLSKGRTIKDIAKFLKISHRTVEDYIGNIKSKLNCHTKTELLDKVFENDFF